jgi:uncharacterized protein YjiS (DUF1127 family)
MTMFTDRLGHGAFRDFRYVSPHRSWWLKVGTAVGDIVTTLLDWQERARQRRQLLSFDTAALKDFGKSRADAASEGEKPFWRA